jgi:hypothetical protein
MKEIPQDIMRVFLDQGVAVVSTLNPDGSIHNSCKGIVNIEQKGKVALLDLYLRKTFANLKQNPNISITVFDEHSFVGYSLIGKAKILKLGEIDEKTLKSWEDKLNSRITHRIIKNIHGEPGHPRHPEAFLPKPEYMITAEVAEITDLTPQHIRRAIQK